MGCRQTQPIAAMLEPVSGLSIEGDSKISSAPFAEQAARGLLLIGVIYISAMNNTLLALSAVKLAHLILEREVSSREVVETHLRRIDRVNKHLSAVVQLDAERALRSAIDVDKELSHGVTQGLFNGVPFTVKDWIET